MNENIKRMADMEVKKLIMVMSLPAIVSMFVQALYNVVDSIFIANINKEALTAVSLAFPLQLVMISIVVGLSVGVNSYVSRMLGEGNMPKASATARHGIVLGIIVWAIFALFNYFFVEKFYSIFTSDPLVLKYSVQYTSIVMYGSIGMILSLIMNRVQQATGDMMSPMKIQLAGAITNIVLDPIMIFGLLAFPRMEVVGGALATVIGQIVSLIYSIIKIRHNPLDLKLSKLHANFKLDINIIKEVMRVGLPSMLMQGLGAIMVGNVNYILAGLSTLSVAAFGAFFKVNSIFVMPLIGLTQGMMPIVGYNYGAKNKSRVKDAIKFSMGYSLIVTVIGTVVLVFLPEPIMKIFSDIPELISIGVTCMRYMSIGFAFFGITVILIASFQAFGIARLSLISSFMRQVILLIPMAYIFGWLWGVDGVWGAFPVTEGVSLVFTVLYSLKLYRNKIIPAMTA